MFLLFSIGLLLVTLEVSISSCLGKQDAKVTLTLELFNSLLQGFIDVSHLKVLLLDSSQVFDHFVSVFVVRLQDILVLIKLLHVVINYFLDVSLHDLHFAVKYLDLELGFVVLSLLQTVGLFELLNVTDELSVFALQWQVLNIKLLSLLTVTFQGFSLGVSDLIVDLG